MKVELTIDRMKELPLQTFPEQSGLSAFSHACVIFWGQIWGQNGIWGVIKGIKKPVNVCN
ncbi:hypothetical protein [Citrobacter sp. U14242]|uniref:hypothetical protein n=1 Tax=Citrobacter sp. U14242 TaxID=3390192 RepID=UPI00397CEC6D